MVKHEVDVISLTAGILFLVAAGWWGLASRSELPTSGWLVPALLIAFGLLGLLGGRARRTGGNADPGAQPPAY